MNADQSSATGISPARIGQIALNVEDLERATSFYRDVVGLEFLFEAPPSMAFLRCGDVRLMLGEPEDPDQDPAGTILYYEVSDVEAAHRTLRDGGAAVVREPGVVHRTEGVELWIGFYRDSERNLFATMAEVPATGSRSERKQDG